MNTMYYGVHEYPENSGNWYTGKYTPIITRELFEKVQGQINKEGRNDYGAKEFAFTKLITCGHCGSGITAQEKFKKLADGTTAKYIYYGCTRGRDRQCKGGYLREEEMINQLMKLIDQLDVNELTVKYHIDIEYERYRKFQAVLGVGSLGLKAVPKIDAKAYARYLLRSGSIMEKREILSSFKSKIRIKDKVLSLFL